MEKVKGKLKVKVRPKSKAIKPKMGRGSGGFMTARILTEVKKKRK